MNGRIGLARVAAVVAGTLIFGWWSPGLMSGSIGLRRPGDVRPNLILITVDSLRADHLGVYGYARPTSPAIDALAREAVVVSDAMAQAPYTKASMATLFTGLFPSAHKTYTTTVPLPELQRSGSVGHARVEETDVLSPALPTLPAALRAAGYFTIGISSNPYLIPDFGFANGFSSFTYVKGRAASYARADEVMTQALRAAAEAPQPYFLWVHLMDAHNPYDTPDPYRAMFPPLRPAHPIDPARIPDYLRIDDSNDLNLYLARYDAGIRAADTAVGRLVAALRANGTWDRTGIVFTADHGEGFMEHNLMSHNNSLYNELLHVPLIIKLPGLRPAHVQATVQLADLFPTLARVAGAALPKTLHGTDLLPVLRGAGSGEPYAYSELVGVRFALQSSTWKFIASFQGGRELFDLGRDPGEHTNLARTNPARSDQLEHLLGRALSTALKDGETTTRRQVLVSPVVLERLKALGYVAR